MTLSRQDIYFIIRLLQYALDYDVDEPDDDTSRWEDDGGST